MDSKRHMLLMVVASIHFSKSDFTVNIARGKPTTTSSIHILGYPWHAVDGNTDGNMAHSSCTHTRPGSLEHWWMVDLQGIYLIHNVTITNRNTLPERLHNFVVEIFSQNPNGCARARHGICYNYTGLGLPVGQTTIICDEAMKGRFVRVRKWHVEYRNDVLTLCEVEIYSSQDGCGTPKYFWRTTGTRLLSENSVLFNDTSYEVCVETCSITVSCLAFNFNVNSLQCEIISSSSFNNTTENRPDWDYYGSDAC